MKLKGEKMIYTKKTKEAMKLMFEKHKSQLDKSGLPYVHHPLHVAEQMKDENTTIVALLHDVIEDTDMTIEQLEPYDFPKEAIEALRLMTHEKGLDYFDYIKRLSKNPIARKVKLADLEHNMDLSRLNRITEENKKRIEKYQKSHQYLEELEK